jgi:hypothetical protein
MSTGRFYRYLLSKTRAGTHQAVHASAGEFRPGPTDERTAQHETALALRPVEAQATRHAASVSFGTRRRPVNIATETRAPKLAGFPLSGNRSVGELLTSSGAIIGCLLLPLPDYR